MPSVRPLRAEQLYRRCEPQQLPFETTAELAELTEVIGQARAMEALHFGVAIRREGYNLYVLGPAGVGKHSVVRAYLERRAAAAPPPPDWCYVHNFDQPHKPRALRLPSGHGEALRADMEHLVEDLRTALPGAFETEEYHARVQELEDEFKGRREKAFSELAREAQQHGVTLLRTPGGFAFAPVHDGEVIEPDAYEKLPAEERRRIEAVIARLRESLNGIFHQLPQWQRQARDRVRTLNREVAELAVVHLIDELKARYGEFPQVVQHLERVQQDAISNADEFLKPDEDTEGGDGRNAFFRRYRVNLLVDHGGASGAPVVYEDTPVYPNLVGRVEHLAQMGALVTDFMLIKPGALHLANGGYLLLDAHKALVEPFAWEGLKRALYAREARIQSLGQIYSLVSTVSLEPEPIPLDLKVVLLGDRLLYYLLHSYDPDFSELFKVAADFEDQMPSDPDNIRLYARLIATLVRRDGLLHFHRDAVARVIEHAARLVEDSERLSIHMLSLADVLREADHWARERDAARVEREDVQRAIDQQIRRADRLRERIYEEIARGTVLIDTEGARVGQINGLSVIELGGFAFGQPARITATARLGEGEVVDIEREVELGGAFHSKGVLILSAYLAARYSSERPLSLHASLVFEQSYAMIDGDSASVAELCALLSALAGVPLRQDLAVTGSVNQLGQVQAIGGVNEKIEGFFDVCSQRGLRGDQGVLIPGANVADLMLRQEVVDAVAAGHFHIWPLADIDEALELLTGMEAGIAGADGRFPPDTVNRRVQERLDHLAEVRHEFAKPAAEGDEDPKSAHREEDEPSDG